MKHLSRFTRGILAVLLMGISLVAQDVYSADVTHSDVSFKIRHLLSKTAGRFTKFEAEIVHQPKNISASSVTFTIDAASINTDNVSRDTHLRSQDFFDAPKYPTLSFVSRKVSAGSLPGQMTVIGDLTMHGVTQTLTIPVTFLGSQTSPFKDVRAGFETTFAINRYDFGMTYAKGVVGETVEISINVEAIQKPRK